MDYIEGKALDYWLKKEGAQPQEKVVEWAKQICDVLGYLHSRKPPIIYRDLKPANVMLKPDGKIMIIDFGTAREFKETSIEDTSCLGTQGYAAPEQYGGHGQTDARTDIYTLGTTMYHLLTGHNPSLPPYEMYPIRQWNPALSSGLEKIVLKCTQRNPADRYQSCAELMYALEHYTELDTEYRRKEGLKWKSFVAACSLTVVSLVGCLGFRFAESSATRSSYDSYISTAATASTQEERAQLYEDAIKINPKEGTAYLNLLQLYVNGTNGDENNFSQDEATAMTAILGYKGSGNRTNESYLESNREAYDDFAFQMGVAYFYSYEGNGNKQMSQLWFEKAAESDTLDPDKVEMSKRFARIAGYYAGLNKVDRSGYSSASYRDYWDDLVSLTDVDLITIVNPETALVMYNELVYQIGENSLNFRRAGVTEDELKSELASTKNRLETTQFASANENMTAVNNESRRNILNNITWAEEQVDIAFSSQEAETSQRGGN